MGNRIEMNRQIARGIKIDNHKVNMSSLSIDHSAIALYFVIIPKLFIEKCKNIN